MISKALLKDLVKDKDIRFPEICVIDGEKFIVSDELIIKTNSEAEDILKENNDYVSYYSSLYRNCLKDYQTLGKRRLLNVKHRKNQKNILVGSDWYIDSDDEESNDDLLIKGNFRLDCVYMDMLKVFYPSAKLYYVDGKQYVIVCDSDEIIGVIKLTISLEISIK